ncbi:prephenate dehydratase [Texcoconibacillus texcoconensis]|nr:prephenate dehydratase [Texcoconibacillus texcoconensis]
MKVGYLGPEGTFTEAATQAALPSVKRVAYETIPKSIDALFSDEVDGVVVPLENTIEGSVNITLDYLIHHRRAEICGEIIVPIQQHFVTHPNHTKSWSSVEVIYSHPHAIAQCHQFLRQVVPHAKVETMSSTGAAAKWLSEQPEDNAAAISNAWAAEKYGLDIVQHDINDYPNNHTRFVLLKNPASKGISISSGQPASEKTTMLVTLPSDYSGALHQVLSAFAWRKLNLTKIESRPMKTELGRYYFIIDVEGHQDTPLFQGAVGELEALGCGVDLLGSYPCFSYVAQAVKETQNYGSSF